MLFCIIFCITILYYRDDNKLNCTAVGQRAVGEHFQTMASLYLRVYTRELVGRREQRQESFVTALLRLCKYTYVSWEIRRKVWPS